MTTKFFQFVFLCFNFLNICFSTELCSARNTCSLRQNSGSSIVLRLRGGCTTPTTIHTESELQRMKLNELQKILRERSLSTKGLKAELIKRLLASYTNAGNTAPAAPVADSINSPTNQVGSGSDQHNKRTVDQIADENEPLDITSHKRFAVSSEENAGAPVQAIPPPVRIQIDGDIDTGSVRVYNSYPVKDKCRALGFKFEATERAWSLPLTLAMDLLGVSSPSEVTEAALLERIHDAAPAAADAAARQASPPPLSVDVTDGEVRVAGGTYFFKDKLRYLGFR